MYYSATRMVRKIYCIGKLVNIDGDLLYHLLSYSLNDRRQKVFQYYHPKTITDNLKSLVFGLNKEEFCWCFEKSIYYDKEACKTQDLDVIEVELPIPIPMLKRDFVGYRSINHAHVLSGDVEIVKQLIEKRNPIHKRDIAFFDNVLITCGNSAITLSNIIVGHSDEIERMTEAIKTFINAQLQQTYEEVKKNEIKEERKAIAKNLKRHSPKFILRTMYKNRKNIYGKTLKEFLYRFEEFDGYRKQLFENPNTHPPAMTKMYRISKLDSRQIKIETVGV